MPAPTAGDASGAVPDALLERLRLAADPLADDTVTAMLCPWHGEQAEAHNLSCLAAANRAIATWRRNGDLPGWQAPAGTPAAVADALAAFVRRAHTLPAWADAAQIERAERDFMMQGVLSCTLLFCASLPECYVLPDLAEVLHTTGQLEKRTDHRIRATAAMIFPVMMPGGLTQPGGSGIAQVLKVRLIHAMARHLVLRGSPAAAALIAAEVPARRPRQASPGMHEALLAHGWDTPAAGLPCNQTELAYTLLTFGYVFARGMRTLGVPLSDAEERACLHTWNVVGHLVGIQPELTVPDMERAAVLFDQIQRLGRSRTPQPDPRPALTAALMRTMAQVIGVRVLQPIPVLLTRLLCGPVARTDLGLNQQVSWLSRAVFALGLGIVRVIDAVGRRISPQFSIARLITRVVGYRLLTRLLLYQTRPLSLPTHLLPEVAAVVADWGTDPQAPRWLNAMEDRMTSKGRWLAS